MHEFLANELLGQCILLFAVLLICRFTPLRYSADFYRYFRFYCARLADKVNKPERTNKQQFIAGIIALVVTLVPLAVILYLFEDLVEIPWIWHAILLWLAVGWHQVRYQSLEIADALKRGQKQLAREKLAPWVLRQTDRLSPVGLVKATIEMHSVKAQQQLFAVIFYYLVAGPLAALIYRLILEMHYSWNPKLERFRFFGACATALTNLFQWLPCRIVTILMLLILSGKHFSLFCRLLSKDFFSAKSALLVHCHALSLGVQLSSPAMYQGIKLRKPVFNDKGRPPEIQDIRKSVDVLEQIQIIICLVALFVAVLNFTLLNNPSLG